MAFIPEHIVTDNPHGILSFGPIAPKEKDDNTAMLLSLDGGHTILCNKNGNKAEINPGKSEEVCGINLVQGDQQEASKEAIAKIITARNGDICIIAENGNIKFIGFETPFLVGCHIAAMSGCRDAKLFDSEGRFPAQKGHLLLFRLRLSGFARHSWSGPLSHFHQNKT